MRQTLFHAMHDRYIDRHSCEVRAETGGCSHLTPTWDNADHFIDKLAPWHLAGPPTRSLARVAAWETYRERILGDAA